MLHNQEEKKKEQSLYKDALWANEIFSSAQQNGDTFPFFLVQYKKPLRGNVVKTDAVFKRVSAPAKLSSL